MTKIIKMDESGPANKVGNQGKHDSYAMFGLMIDAEDFVEIDTRFKEIFSPVVKKYKFKHNEFQSRKMGAMKKREKREILSKICKEILSNDIKIFGIVISMEQYKKKNTNKMRKLDAPRVNEWLICSIYNCAVIQKWIEREEKSSCFAIVFSDHHFAIKNFAEELNKHEHWFDGLYQTKKTPLKHEDRFDRIIDKRVFADRSRNSPVIQAVDVVCHIYRHYFDLLEEGEDYKDENCNSYKKWKYEYNLYKCFFEMLEEKRENIGTTLDTNCVEYYEIIKCDNWVL